jgi:hypothetical protein
MRLPTVYRASLTARFLQAWHRAARQGEVRSSSSSRRASVRLDSKANCLTAKYQARPTVAFRKFNELLHNDESVSVRKIAATRGLYGIRLSRACQRSARAQPRRNVRTQMLLNSGARRISHSHTREKIVSRRIASIVLVAVVATLTGCVVAPGYDYAYAQPYYPGYGYGYGPAYGPAYGTVNIWGGWGGSCCYYHGGHGYWHGGHGGGGWHGGGGGHGGGSSWSSGGGGHGGHGH